MIGAIIGDYIGSAYEWSNIKTTDFPLFSSVCRFTDDSVMSIAVADALMNHLPMADTLRRYGRLFPDAGYGGRFRQWLLHDDMPAYNSFGNGSAMRASAAGWMGKTLEEALDLAAQSAAPTHNHPQGILGAQMVAGCIWLLKNNYSKEELIEWVEGSGYSLDFTLDEIRPSYEFNVTCQGSVPQAIKAFLESTDFESAIRLAISIGGDSDTIACIAGALAEAYYPIPFRFVSVIVNHLPPSLMEPLSRFDMTYAMKLPFTCASAPVLPDTLDDFSCGCAETAWHHLSPSETLFHKPISPFETLKKKITSQIKKLESVSAAPPFTQEMLCTLAYFGEGMVCGSRWADHRAYEKEIILSPGPCTFFMSISPSSNNELMHYMLTAFELAIKDKPYLGDYIIRRTNALHSSSSRWTRDTDFDLLAEMIRYEYGLARAAGHDKAAWKLYGFNMMLHALSMI